MKATQWLIVLVAVVMIPSVFAASCPKYTHFLTPNFNFANNNLIFNSLDMDTRKNGVQDKVTVRPGEDTQVLVSWGWGKTCPDCIVNINVYGSWQDDEIARIYSGIKGDAPLSSSYPVSFKAPDTEGKYRLRVIFSYDKEFASDFDASNLCSSNQCSEAGECHVLIAEGSINVTRPKVNDTTWLPQLEITSPKTTSPDGIAEAGLGTGVIIDASADMRVSNFTVKVDGVKLSDSVPYTWDTVNETEGIHTITVSAVGHGGTIVLDEMKIKLVNRSLIFGDVPSILWSVEFPGKVTGSDISKDGRIAVGLDTGGIYILDRTGVVMYENKTSVGINSVSISSDGKRVVFGGGNTLYYLSGNGSLLWSYKIPGAGGVRGVSVSSDGRRVAFGAGDALYYLSDNGSLLWSYKIPGAGGVRGVSVSSDGRRVAFGAGDTLYYLSDNGSLLWSYKTADADGIKSVSISSDGKHVAVGSGNSVEYLNVSGGLVWNYTQEHMMNLKMVSSGVIGASGNTVFLLSENGQLAWRFLLEGMSTISSSPDGRYTAVVKDRSIIFYGKDGGVSPVPGLPGRRYTIFGSVVIVLVALVCLLFYRSWKSRGEPGGRPKPLLPHLSKPGVKDIGTGRPGDKDVQSSGILKGHKTPKAAAERLARLEKAGLGEGDMSATTAAATGAPVIRGIRGVAGAEVVVRVINAKTGKPVAGVTVSINDIGDKTDKGGTATLRGILPGEQEIFVEREHYEPGRLVQNIKEGENHFEIRLGPGLVLDERQERRLQDTRKQLLDSFNRASNFDACLPGYIRGVGENIIRFAENISYSPELFTTAAGEYSSIMDTLIEIVEEVCTDICEVMTDWRNIDLYKASVELPKADCDAGDIGTELDIVELINEPGRFADMNRASVESKISRVDNIITDRMNELTVIPVSRLWGISRDLLAGDLKGRKKAFGIVIADILGSYVEDMLEDPVIVERLKFSFM